MPPPVSRDVSPSPSPVHSPFLRSSQQDLEQRVQMLAERVEALTQQLESRNQELLRLQNGGQSQEIQHLLESGLEHIQNNELPEAAILFQSILQKEPDHFQAKEHLKRVYRIQGDCFFREQRYMEAIRRYTLGDAFTGVKRVLEAVCAIADELFENEDFKSAKIQYEGIQNSLNGLIKLKRLNNTSIAEDFREYHAIILQRIRRVEIAALSEEANQRLESFEEVRQDVGASLSQLREYDDTLFAIQQLYVAVMAKDSAYSAPPRFMELYTEVRRQLEVAEAELLKQYSLKKADALEPIKKQCEKWIAVYNKLGSPPDLAEKQKLIEQIKTHAEASLKKLSELELQSLAAHVLLRALSKKDPAYVSDEERNGWIEYFMDCFATTEEVRDHFVSLTPEGHARFRKILWEDLGIHLVRDSWIPSFCCCDAKYKIKGYPSSEDIESWLDHCLAEGCIKDIRELLDPPPPYHRQAAEVGEIVSPSGAPPPPSDGEGEEGVPTN